MQRANAIKFYQNSYTILKFYIIKLSLTKLFSLKSRIQLINSYNKV